MRRSSQNQRACETVENSSFSRARRRWEDAARAASWRADATVRVGWMVRTRRNWEHATTRVCEENTAVVQRRPSQAANGNEPARVEVCVAEEFQRRRPFVLSTVRKKRFERGWSGTQSSGRSECSAQGSAWRRLEQFTYRPSRSGGG